MIIRRATILFEIGGVVAGSALRLTACAGLLTTGLLMAAARAGIAVADTGDSAGGGTERASVTSKVEGGSGRESGATKPDHPTSTGGSGRDDIDVKSAVGFNSKNGNSADSKKSNGSITDPIQRIPRKDELPATGLPNPCFFYTTLVKPVLTLAATSSRRCSPRPHLHRRPAPP